MESGSVQGGNYFPQDFELNDIEEEQREEEDNATTTENDNIGAADGTRKTTKKRKKRSKAWEGFTVLEVGDGDPPVDKRKGQCNFCGTLIAADGDTNGTSGLLKHARTCKVKNAIAKKDGQTKLAFKAGVGDCSGSLFGWKFSQKDARLALCEMIVLDELPFKFVEKEGFRKYNAVVCPDFNIPSRQTIRADCLKLFIEKKESLKTFFKKTGMGRVSLTTDCWTAINNINFICVTAHLIGEDWKLHKKIIGFRKIVGHKGDDIGAAIVEVMTNWDVKNILCCTVDNAGANDGAVKQLSKSLDSWNTNVMDGKYLHVRCVAHIMNLLVSSGLEEIGVSVRRVREAVKWVKASPARAHSFYEFAVKIKIDSQKKLCLDVPTRWNSTYLMLEAAEPYALCFNLFAGWNPDLINDVSSKKYKDHLLGYLVDEDWVNMRKMIDYLKIFYNFTLVFSGTTYVTGHLFFKEMTVIFESISELEKSTDKEISSMANKMKSKLAKYWMETDDLNPKMNTLLYIAAILDPRQKLDHVETCMTQVYGDARANTLLASVKIVLRDLFDIYRRQQLTSDPPDVSCASSEALHSSAPSQSELRLGRPIPRGSGIIVPKRIESTTDNFSELTMYYSEPQHSVRSTCYRDYYDDDIVDSFNILKWWKKEGVRYRVLSDVARDILAIPISTVASESAFSMGGRVLDQFRSSLHPDMVEALICSSDWLRSSPTFMLDDEDVPEEEQQREIQSVLTAIGVVAPIVPVAPIAPIALGHVGGESHEPATLQDPNASISPMESVVAS